MARIVSSQEIITPTILGNIPTLGVCVEADSYEDALLIAQQHAQMVCGQKVAEQMMRMLQEQQRELDNRYTDDDETENWLTTPFDGSEDDY